ncbi:MAG: HAD family hydrolase [Pseudoxanthomonas sp.]
MKKVLIFDFDNCLAPATEVGEELFRPAFDAMRRANAGRLSEERLARAFADVWRLPLDVVASRHGFPDDVREAAWEVFRGLEVARPMHGYGDLEALRALPAEKILVTTGFRRLQESKVRALGIADCFGAIHVDAIDEPGHPGKLRIFEEILRSEGLHPDEALVIGDNADAEIAAGRRLGIETVQTLRPGVPHADNATHRIRSLHELAAIAGSAAQPSRDRPDS